jgi:hypothetical protein
MNLHNDRSYEERKTTESSFGGFTLGAEMPAVKSGCGNSQRATQSQGDATATAAVGVLQSPLGRSSVENGRGRTCTTDVPVI